MTQKQTKKKSPKLTKKQPISVQLSKDDLKELLIVVKNFTYENILVELNRQNKRVFLNCSELDKRVSNLEMVENNHRKEIHKLKQCCSHDDRFKSVWYSSWNPGEVLGGNYECIGCKRIITKTTILLSWREKRALRKLGVQI